MSPETSLQTVVVVGFVRHTTIASGLKKPRRAEDIQRTVDEALMESGALAATWGFGDGAILVFDNAVSATTFAEALHRNSVTWSQGQQELHVKVGISTGETSLTSGTPAGQARVSATRLEKVCRTGEVLIDAPTWAALPPEVQQLYGPEEVISGKRQEYFHAHRRAVVARAPWDDPTPLSARANPPVAAYIRSLQVSDIKGIPATRLDFAETPEDAAGWFVLAGGNGSGKTTLLRSLAAASIGSPALRLIDSSWKSNGAEEGTVIVSYLGDADSADPPMSTLEVRDTAARPLDGVSITLGSKSGTGTTLVQGWYLSGYGPFKRLEGGSDHARELARSDPQLGRVATLFLEEASLWEVPKWLFRLGVDDKRADFRADLFALLNSGLLPDGFEVERIVDEDLVLTAPNGSLVSLLRVSDGPRCMLALVLDIVREFEVCHGQVEIREGRVHNPGVVLIDEPDNHLHILWQMNLGFWMKEHFPHIQFIVATHSPFLCSAADKIWRLDDEAGQIAPAPLSVEEMRMIRTGSIGSILESDAFRIFNTMPPGARDRHLEFLELRRLSLQGKRLSPAEKERLEELEAEFLGPSVPPDPEFETLFSS